MNYSKYLKRRLMVGQIDPWRRHDDGKPILCLLTSVDTALDECKLWSNQDLSRSDLIKDLEANRILVLKSVDEFVKVKQELKEQTDETPLKPKRKLTEEHKQKLRNHANLMREKKKASIT